MKIEISENRKLMAEKLGLPSWLVEHDFNSHPDIAWLEKLVKARDLLNEKEREARSIGVWAGGYFSVVLANGDIDGMAVVEKILLPPSTEPLPLLSHMNDVISGSSTVESFLEVFSSDEMESQMKRSSKNLHNIFGEIIMRHLVSAESRQCLPKLFGVVLARPDEYIPLTFSEMIDQSMSQQLAQVANAVLSRASISDCGILLEQIPTDSSDDTLPLYELAQKQACSKSELTELCARHLRYVAEAFSKGVTDRDKCQWEIFRAEDGTLQIKTYDLGTQGAIDQLGMDRYRNISQSLVDPVVLHKVDALLQKITEYDAPTPKLVAQKHAARVQLSALKSLIFFRRSEVVIKKDAVRMVSSSLLSLFARFDVEQAADTARFRFADVPKNVTDELIEAGVKLPPEEIRQLKIRTVDTLFQEYETLESTKELAVVWKYVLRTAVRTNWDATEVLMAYITGLEEISTENPTALAHLSAARVAVQPRAKATTVLELPPEPLSKPQIVKTATSMPIAPVVSTVPSKAEVSLNPDQNHQTVLHAAAEILERIQSKTYSALDFNQLDQLLADNYDIFYTYNDMLRLIGVECLISLNASSGPDFTFRTSVFFQRVAGDQQMLFPLRDEHNFLLVRSVEAFRRASSIQGKIYELYKQSLQHQIQYLLLLLPEAPAIQVYSASSYFNVLVEQDLTGNAVSKTVLRETETFLQAKALLGKYEVEKVTPNWSATYDLLTSVDITTSFTVQQKRDLILAILKIFEGSNYAKNLPAYREKFNLPPTNPRP